MQFTWLDNLHFYLALALIEWRWWRALTWFGWEREHAQIEEIGTGKIFGRAAWIRRYRNNECLMLEVTFWGAGGFNYETSKCRIEWRKATDE